MKGLVNFVALSVLLMSALPANAGCEQCATAGLESCQTIGKSVICVYDDGSYIHLVQQ